jgi:hypothetical protein
MGKVNIYHVLWIDSCSQPGWQFFSDIEPMEPLECESVGFVVERNQASVTLCLSFTENALAHMLTIPKSCVKKMTKIGESHSAFQK